MMIKRILSLTGYGVLWLAIACGGKASSSETSGGGAPGATGGTGGGGAGTGGDDDCVELREPGSPAFDEVPGGGEPLQHLEVQRIAGPDERDLRAVWARSANDVFAVGRGVLHWDGCRWSSMRDAGDYYSIWGTETDVWVGGNRDAGCACCRCVGEVVHFDGVTWQELPTVSAVSSVWASGPNDVWAGVAQAASSPDVLPLPAVLRWDGETWEYASPSSSPSSTQYFVLGRGDSVYMGGSGIRRWDGTAFVALDVQSQCSPGRGVSGDSLWFGSCRVDSGAPVVTEFFGRWGASTEDVWSVGPGGEIVRFNGTGTLAVESGTENDLDGVWGATATDVWVVGKGGTILHFAP